MNKEMKRPISNITQDSIKPLLSNAVEFYTNKNREAHKCIQERDEYINYLESKLSNAKPQRALPVVPEFVAEWYEEEKDSLEFAVYDINTSIHRKSLNDRTKIEKWFARADNKPIETVFKMKNGYTVKKPQLFYIELPNVYGMKNKVFVSKVENGTIVEFSRGKDYALALTEQKIKAIDERYWKFAVPVEVGK